VTSREGTPVNTARTTVLFVLLLAAFVAMAVTS
jgi:hypothetical protein